MEPVNYIEKRGQKDESKIQIMWPPPKKKKRQRARETETEAEKERNVRGEGRREGIRSLRTRLFSDNE